MQRRGIGWKVEKGWEETAGGRKERSCVGAARSLKSALKMLERKTRDHKSSNVRRWKMEDKNMQDQIFVVKSLVKVIRSACSAPQSLAHP